ncbi:tetratricopeptide repeat protein [Halochromatium glycolicum]|uniref:tetratricopeptide repeat protein n=1 Tax=Halochromatium glycolicum TaxID=85075 RepID=UPI00190AAAC6|nr:tetratricopeptide repeat protein [Halochromatium glycolicum]
MAPSQANNLQLLPDSLAMSLQNTMKHCLSRLILLSLLLMATENSLSVDFCPPLKSSHGNRDYLDPSNQHHVGMVERYHFNEDVRQLRGGARPSGSLVGDLEYTLNWFPNHHVALDTLVRLAIKKKNPMPLGAEHIECRFEWARKVNPQDGMVEFIEAQYRFKIGEHDQAKILLKNAARLSPRNANVLYNVGLLYFRMKEYEKAHKYAQSAYELGFPLPGLREMLSDAGYPLDES